LKGSVALLGGAPVLVGLMWPVNQSGGAALVLLALVTMLRGAIQLLPLSKKRKIIYINLGVVLLLAAVFSALHAHQLRDAGDTNSFWEVNWSMVIGVLILAWGAAVVDRAELSEKRKTPTYKLQIDQDLKGRIDQLNLSIGNSTLRAIDEALIGKLTAEIEAFHTKRTEMEKERE
jgi:hypothetical protein